MKKNKLTKIVAGVVTAGTALSIMAPSVHAQEATEYVVTQKSIYTVENGVKGETVIDIVTNPGGGPVLGLLHNEDGPDGKNLYILEVEEGGKKYAFKDMDKDGELDVYEDWRKSDEERAEDLAKQLADAQTPDGIKKIAGLMLFSSHEGDSAAGLTDNQKAYLDGSFVRNITDAAGNNVTDSVGWVNAMQAHVERSSFNVPVDFSSDPRSTAGSGDLYSDNVDGSDISAWPSNIGMAATFNTDHMYNFAKATSAEYRAMGIVTALGPQIDLATEPRWLRVGGTFGENTKLATDMAQAYVDGSQSTYGSDGSDLGWGEDSINCMIKHFPGDGAGEAGRESHTRAGKYAVYPTGNFEEHLIPFTEGGLKLKGETKSATAIMTSYSIGINADGTALGGDRVGSAYSKYKMDLLRKSTADGGIGFDGVVCTDWSVTNTPPADGVELTIMTLGTAWGKETATQAERHYDILMAGTDMFGGNNNSVPIEQAFDMMVADNGGDDTVARERFETSAKRLILLTMRPGLFENPYLDKDASNAIAGSDDKMAAGYAAQLDSVVMLKNKDNVIKKADQKAKDPKDMTVYIPMTYTKAQKGIFAPIPEEWSNTMNVNVAETIYGKVITDTVVDGKIITPDISEVDQVIIGMRSPNNGSLFNEAGMKLGADGKETFYPLSLQYSEYTADGDNVRKTSIAGNILSDGSQQNRSYYGAKSDIANEYDLTACLNAVEAVKATGKDIPIVVSLNANSPVIVSEFEDKVDAIVVGFSVSDKAVFDIINGKSEPKGLLPLQFPANMDTVEANAEDKAGDLVCHKDTEGNTYDVAYGLNWSGLIDDERVNNYNPNRPTTEVKPNPEKPGDGDGAIVDTNTGTKTKPTSTGDATNINGLMFAMLGAAAIAVTGTVVYRKKKIKE